MCGFIAQLVEHRTGIAEVMGSNPVEALICYLLFFIYLFIFFRLLLSNCLNWKITAMITLHFHINTLLFTTNFFFFFRSGMPQN